VKLSIGIPYYGQCHALFNRCLDQLKRQPPCKQLSIIDIIGDSLIPRARNYLAWKFLHETDSDALLFIDSDIIFAPGHVQRILSHDLEQYPCIGGMYPKKQPQVSWVLNTFEDGPTTAGPDGLLPVKYAGTGFLLITRKLLETIMERHPDFLYRADNDEQGSNRYDFFPTGPRNRILPHLRACKAGEERYLSEDWAFCELVRSAGFPVMVDTEVRLEHYGWVHYPIRSDQVLTREELHSIHIGSALQNHLSNVAIHHGKTEDGQDLRLVDVDALVQAVLPPDVKEALKEQHAPADLPPAPTGSLIESTS
jgi:hypothetical protein